MRGKARYLVFRLIAKFLGRFKAVGLNGEVIYFPVLFLDHLVTLRGKFANNKPETNWHQLIFVGER